LLLFFKKEVLSFFSSPGNAMLKRRNLLTAAAATPLFTGSLMTEAAAADLSNTVLMQIKYGTVTIVLRPDLAPLASERIKVLTQQGFYDGCQFFRVIPGFVAQTGDRSNTGTQGSSLPDLPAEFTNDASFLTGAVGMARTSDPNSANSQFYICLAPATFLDGQYTLVGQVTSGMEAVQQIKAGAGQSGAVTDPDSIIKMTLAS
jgi:cyclophilin family peptidyl-prolyl cis-trans isomerase